MTMKTALLYLAMLMSAAVSAKEFTQQEVDRFNHLVNSANKIIEPFVIGQQPQLVDSDKEKLSSAIAMYDEAIAIDGLSWAPVWFKGKAYKAAGNLPLAYSSFKQAYGIIPSHPDLANEYVLAAIHLNKTDEAFEINSKAAKQFPTHLSLQANLALVMILVAKPDEAIAQAQRALEISPEDQFTLQLLSIAKEIQTGVRAQPKDVFELSN